MSRWARLKLLIGILLLASDGAMSYIPEFEVMTSTMAVENGRQQMQKLSQRSNLPSDEGSCWKSALENLEIGCKLLTEEIQVRMALRFTSCFNEMLGLPPYICEPTTPVKECLKQLDSSSQSTFREYFLHTQDMCYYLKQEIWQEQTNNAVNRLTDAATDVTLQMLEQKNIQQQIYHSQQESLQVQTNMKKDNEDLYNAVVKVKDVFDDFSATTKEHQLISTEIFDKLSRMQKLVAWIHGEMSLLDMILFYFGAMLFGYFATSTARTRAARFWLIILFMTSIWSEKALFKYLQESDFAVGASPEDMQAFVWMVRKFAAVSATLIVIISAAFYRDIETVNNNILMSMNFSMEKVVQYINEQRSGTGAKTASDVQQLINSKPEDADDEDSDDDTFSNYSSDDSMDNLDHELKMLCQDAENTENVAPRGQSSFGRFFRKTTSSTALSPIQHRYNLRERSATPRENSVVNESVTEFARAVKGKKPPKPADSPLNFSCFSSDEEQEH